VWVTSHKPCGSQTQARNTALTVRPPGLAQGHLQAKRSFNKPAVTKTIHGPHLKRFAVGSNQQVVCLRDSARVAAAAAASPATSWAADACEEGRTNTSEQVLYVRRDECLSAGGTHLDQRCRCCITKIWVLERKPPPPH
jgi:hypothetical protein